MTEVLNLVAHACWHIFYGRWVQRSATLLQLFVMLTLGVPGMCLAHGLQFVACTNS